VKPVQAEQLLASLERAGVFPDGNQPILVVDDDQQARRLIEATLQSLGYRACGAASGEEGLEVARTSPPAAVVLDLLMPKMDGFEFLERFRRTPAGRRTPVIVWTAKDLDAQDQSRLAALAQAVVLKREGGARPLIEELRAWISPPPAHATPETADPELGAPPSDMPDSNKGQT
jgi:CheY-like chemotaxis protein